MTETLVPKNYRAIIDQLTKENDFDEGLPRAGSGEGGGGAMLWNVDSNIAEWHKNALEKCHFVPFSAAEERLGDGLGEWGRGANAGDTASYRARCGGRPAGGAAVVGRRVLSEIGFNPRRTRDFTGRSTPNNIKVIRTERRALGTVVMAAELRLVGISRFSYLHTSRNRGL
jgi:hypothetical protein